MDLREDTPINITVDMIAQDADGALTTTRKFEDHAMDLGDLVYVVGLAELSRFSTDAPTALSQILSTEIPSGEGCILTINTVDGVPPTPELLVEIGEIYGIQFKHNPFLADMRRNVADNLLADADLFGRQVAATDGWEHGHDELVQKVFLENGDSDSQIMTFRVNFKPNSSNTLGDPEFEVPEMTGADDGPQI